MRRAETFFVSHTKSVRPVGVCRAGTAAGYIYPVGGQEVCQEGEPSPAAVESFNQRSGGRAHGEPSDRSSPGGGSMSAKPSSVARPYVTTIIAFTGAGATGPADG